MNKEKRPQSDVWCELSQRFPVRLFRRRAWLCCRLVVLGWAAGLIPYVHGADLDEEVAGLSLVAVGEVPERRIRILRGDIAGGGRSAANQKLEAEPLAVIEPPLPGKLPPLNLYYRAGRRDGEKVGGSEQGSEAGTWKSVRLGFNRVSGVERVQAGMRLSLMRRRADGSHHAVVSLPALKAGSQWLVLLFPNPGGGMPWLGKPVVRMLNLGSRAMAGKNVLIRNDSKREVRVRLGAEWHRSLAPRRRVSVSYPPVGGYTALRAVDAGSGRVLVDSAVRLSERAVELLVFYPAARGLEQTSGEGGEDVRVLLMRVERLAGLRREKEG